MLAGHLCIHYHPIKGYCAVVEGHASEILPTISSVGFVVMEYASGRIVEQSIAFDFQNAANNRAITKRSLYDHL